MIKGTTPTLILKVKNGGQLDLTVANSVYATIRQRDTAVTKSGNMIEVAAQQVSVWLTQQESLRLRQGPAEAQINWTYTDLGGNLRRAATKPTQIQIGPQLLERVVE